MGKNKDKKNELTVLESVAIDTSLNKDDIISIKVSDFEMELLQNIDNQHKVVCDLQSTHKKDCEKLDKMVNSAADKEFGYILRPLHKALVAAGFKENLATLVAQEDWEGKEVNVTLSIGSGYRAETRRLSTPMPKKIIAAKEKLDILNEKISAWKEYGVKLKKRLASMDTQERLARANMAKTIASLSSEGRALMKAMDGGSHADMLALPAPPK